MWQASQCQSITLKNILQLVSIKVVGRNPLDSSSLLISGNTRMSMHKCSTLSCRARAHPSVHSLFVWFVPVLSWSFSSVACFLSVAWRVLSLLVVVVVVVVVFGVSCLRGASSFPCVVFRVVHRLVVKPALVCLA